MEKLSTSTELLQLVVLMVIAVIGLLVVLVAMAGTGNLPHTLPYLLMPKTNVRPSWKANVRAITLYVLAPASIISSYMYIVCFTVLFALSLLGKDTSLFMEYQLTAQMAASIKAFEVLYMMGVSIIAVGQLLYTLRCKAVSTGLTASRLATAIVTCWVFAVVVFMHQTEHVIHVFFTCTLMSVIQPESSIAVVVLCTTVLLTVASILSAAYSFRGKNSRHQGEAYFGEDELHVWREANGQRRRFEDDLFVINFVWALHVGWISIHVAVGLLKHSEYTGALLSLVLKLGHTYVLPVVAELWESKRSARRATAKCADSCRESRTPAHQPLTSLSRAPTAVAVIQECSPLPTLCSTQCSTLPTLCSPKCSPQCSTHCSTLPTLCSSLPTLYSPRMLAIFCFQNTHLCWLKNPLFFVTADS